MNRPTTLRLLALAALPIAAQAQIVYLDETFDTDTIGAVPADPARYTGAQVLTAAGSGLMGADNLAHFNDTGSGGGSLEYNVGGSALGALFVSFDIFNNAANATGTAANPIIFGIGNWSTSGSTLLGANANRGFGLEFYQTGSSNTVRIRVGGTVAYQGLYDMAAVIKVSVFINDHDTESLGYVVPGGSGATATLGANSAVVYLNDTLVGAEPSIGFVMSTATGSGNTTGNATLGRFGFNSSTTNTPNFLIDNLYASSIPSAIPEPSAFAALAGLATLGLAAARRRRA